MEAKGSASNHENSSRSSLLNFIGKYRIIPLDQNKKINSTINFWLVNPLQIKKYLDWLDGQRIFTKAVVELHQNYYRKATDDPYFKHLFATGKILYELYGNENIGLNEAGLLHDKIELENQGKRTTNYTGLDLYKELINYGVENIDNLKEIVVMSDILTPPPKSDDISESDWKKVKKEFFKYILNLTLGEVTARYNNIFPNSKLGEDRADTMAGYCRLVKFADQIANMDETIADLRLGVDGIKGKNGLKDLAWRVSDFRERLELGNEKLGENINYIAIFQKITERLELLEGFLARESKESAF